MIVLRNWHSHETLILSNSLGVLTRRLASNTNRARHSTPQRCYGAALLRCGCRSCDRLKCASHCIDRCFDLAVQSMPFRKPARIVVRKPRVARSILPNECLERQIDADRLCSIAIRFSPSSVSSATSLPINFYATAICRVVGPSPSSVVRRMSRTSLVSL
jgi:hypothetical protein